MKNNMNSFTADMQMQEMRKALDELHINPGLILDIIYSLGNIIRGNGYGEIQVMIRDKKVTTIYEKESILVHQATLVLESRSKE